MDLQSKAHHRDFGERYFSHLPEEIQAQILSYEVSVDLLINLPDSEVLDIFSRLNSYAVILNQQEKINAEHFGPFKVLADKIGRTYTEYWTKNGILTARKILRMSEVTLVADLLIAMREGIKSSKQIRKYYNQYESNFDEDVDDLERKFDTVINVIAKLYPEGLSSSEFQRPFLFYSIFTAVAHCLYGLPDMDVPRLSLDLNSEIEAARNGLDRVEELFEAREVGSLNREEQQFLQDSRRATTDERVRERRTKFLLQLMT